MPKVNRKDTKNLDEFGCPAAVASVAVESRRLKVSLSNARAEMIPSNFGWQLPGITVEGSEHMVL